MTKKRFTLDETFMITDNEKLEIINPLMNSKDVGKVCELLNKLAEENEQLKLQLQNTSDQRDEFHRGARENANRVGKLEKENEQLKEQNADWETAFDNCKHYKEAYGTEIVKIKQTIKDMMENERTELGRSVLKQLWEAIQ